MSGFRRFLMLLNTDSIPECKIIDLHSFLIELKKRLIQKTAFTGLACSLHTGPFLGKSAESLFIYFFTMILFPSMVK
jgi:hypothetical protein